MLPRRQRVRDYNRDLFCHALCSVAYTLRPQVSHVVPVCGMTTIFLSREEEVLRLSAAETHVPTVFGASKTFNPF